MPSILSLLVFYAPRGGRAARGLAAGLLGLLLLAGATGPAQAQRRHPRAPVATAKRPDETATPSLSRHLHDAQRITGYLADALRLSTAQQIALQNCTLSERAALLLATSDNDAQAAQARYLASVRRVLASSQLRSYVQLRQQLEGTMLPLDGLGIVAR
ncbi:MAG: hypothetical protein M3Y12_05360 [Bacteroidota bacterium]|nr:hypothetical protein [Bacteroidota bacterium]